MASNKKMCEECGRHKAVAYRMIYGVKKFVCHICLIANTGE